VGRGGSGNRWAAVILLVLGTAGCVGTEGDGVTQGRQIVADQQCDSCHQANLSGGMLVNGVRSANITPDVATGVGTWTDANLDSAIRTGIDDAGLPLSTEMPRFTLDDGAIGALIAYLHSVPPVVNDVSALP
jgi:mono/diheme cytochrome c family protein